jgi:hypothetical protein
MFAADAMSSFCRYKSRANARVAAAGKAQNGEVGAEQEAEAEGEQTATAKIGWTSAASRQADPALGELLKEADVARRTGRQSLSKPSLTSFRTASS